MSTSPIETIDHTNAEPIAPESGVMLDYEQEGQNVALLNIAHTGLRVRSERGAAFRCMGLFEDLDALKKHYGGLPSDGYETIAHKCRAWKLIPPTPPADPAAETAAVAKVLSDDSERRAEKLKEFERRRREKEKFKNPHTPSVGEGPSERPSERPSEGPGVHGQKYACVGLVRSGTTAMVMFLAAFPTEAECRRYARDTAANHHTFVDLFSVRMYEWVLVADAYKCENWGFRHKKLDDFFQTRHRDNIEAEQWKRKMALQDKKKKAIADSKKSDSK